VKLKTAQDFYDAVRENFAADRNVNPMRLNQAVMTMLAANVSGRELEKLRLSFRRIFAKFGLRTEGSVDLSDFD
jgi:uncharacterized protein (DUF2267 family)